MDCDLRVPEEAIDKALVHRIAGGDRTALCTLYRGHHTRLCRMLFQLTRRSEVLEEVIEDCFWVAWNAADEYAGNIRVSTWLMGIAYRSCIEALRYCPSNLTVRGRTGAGGSMPVAPQRGHHSHPDPFNRLQALTIDQRVILELVYGAGQTLEEVAAIVGSDLGEIRSKLLGARALL